MPIAQNLSTLALKEVIDGACAAIGFKVGSESMEGLVGFVARHFTDHSQRLVKALQAANERTWQALEIALAGESFWNRLAAADDKAFRQHVRAFLDALPMPELQGKTQVRQQCLRDLREARKSGVLTSGTLDVQQLVKNAANSARFADSQRVLDHEWQWVKGIAAQVEAAGYCNLAWLLALRPAQGQPILTVGVRFFFRRAVEEDPKLFQGLAFAQLEGLGEAQKQSFARLSKAQQEGFTALAIAQQQHGHRLEELLQGLLTVAVEARDAAVGAREAAVGAKDAVADLEAKLEKWQAKVVQLLEQHQVRQRTLRASDSFSIRNDSERQLIKDLIRQYRALPADQQRRKPALLGDVGKLEFLAGDFEAAQKDFQTVTTLVADPATQAEAHFNAYRVALERRDWATALRELIGAVKVEAKRFMPFPMGKYQPQRILGAGGFGVAFLCKHRHMDAQVVVKALQLDNLDRDADKVFTEAQVLRQLDHPAIIRIQDCAYVDSANKSRPYLVMDYFDGVTLEEYVKENGPLPPEDAVQVATMTAEALKAAHAKNILHRDVKPANLLVRRGSSPEGLVWWDVKLIDFGLALKHSAVDSTAQALGPSKRTATTDSLAGTLDYAAPEQMGRLSGVSVGPYSDIYGFAKTCCYALFKTPQPTYQHWRQLPESVAELLGKCLEEMPGERLSDMGTILQRMNKLKFKPQPAKATGQWHAEPTHAPVAKGRSELEPEILEVVPVAPPVVQEKGVFKSKRLFPVTVPNLNVVADDVGRHFQQQGFEIAKHPTPAKGWQIDIRKGSDFQAVLGLKTALKVEIEPAGNGTVVKAGVGIFEQQAIPTVLMLFVAWPVIITQVWGLVKQAKLDDEAMNAAERSLMQHSQPALAVPQLVAPVPPSPKGKFCSNCGHAVKDGAKFCPECGTKIG